MYGAWPYPTYRPVVLAQPPGYAFDAAVATGLAFAAGAAVIGGLWGWARPAWGGAGRTYVNVNVERYNVINVNRTTITSNRWQAPFVGGRPAFFPRPPSGPVGMPARPGPRPPGAPVGPGPGLGPVPPVFRPGWPERPPPAYFPPGTRPQERPPATLPVRPPVTVPGRPPEGPPATLPVRPPERPAVTLPARPPAPPPRPVAPPVNPNPAPSPPPVRPRPANPPPPVHARPPGPPPNRPPPPPAPPRPPSKQKNNQQQ